MKKDNINELYMEIHRAMIKKIGKMPRAMNFEQREPSEKILACA
jgi:hypothetical protein